MDYRRYLFKSINEPGIFKESNTKKDIICNFDNYEISSFFRNDSVTSEMIYVLFDNEGLSILRSSDNYLSRFSSLICCGKDISELYDNELFLDMLAELNGYYSYLNNIGAYKFINYCIGNNLNVKFVFDMLNEEAQVYVIKNCDLSEYYYDLLISGKTECSKIIIDKISSLDNYNYYDLLDLFSKDISIPERLLTRSLINKICSIYDVRKYRNLIDNLGKNNDVSNIENLRRNYYDNFLDKCFDIYHDILVDVKNGESLENTLKKYFGSFEDYNYILSKVHNNDNFGKVLAKSMNYVTTDIVVDYIFNDYSSNVFLDINELVRFNNSSNILSPFDKEIYSQIVLLDELCLSKKKELLDYLKRINMREKFYDDFRCARKEMVQMFNDSILNKKNSIKYENKDLSIKYGVPVYEMNGNDFYVFVKSLVIRKDEVLTDRDLRVSYDSGSFSIDGSNKLQTIDVPNLFYNLAFDRIPDDQLIHVFEADSHSNYSRNSNNVPSDNSGTNNINRLYTPNEFVSISDDYNELIVAQPNETRDDEFNFKLEKIRPFAIYCYDDICDNDIISAKNLGLDIILVRTNKYSIDNSNRISMDLLNRTRSGFSYIKPNEIDYSRRL